MKHSADASVLGYFSRSYSDFSAKRSQFFSENAYSSSVDQAVQELRVETPDAAIGAWKACVLRHKDLYSWIDAADDPNEVTLGLGWDPAGGLGALQSVSASLSNVANPNDLNSLRIFAKGQRPFILRRSDAHKPIRVTVHGTVNPGTANEFSYGTDFYLPPAANRIPGCCFGAIQWQAGELHQLRHAFG